jgi:hypothetical protein
MPSSRVSSLWRSSPTVAALSALSSAFVAGALLFLCLSDGAVFGDGDSSALAEEVWLVLFFFFRKGSSSLTWGFYGCLHGSRSYCFWVAFFDEVEVGSAGFLLPLPTPERQRQTVLQRARCVMEDTWCRILRRFQCLVLLLGFGTWICLRLLYSLLRRAAEFVGVV